MVGSSIEVAAAAAPATESKALGIAAAAAAEEAEDESKRLGMCHARKHQFSLAGIILIARYIAASRGNFETDVQ